MVGKPDGNRIDAQHSGYEVAAIEASCGKVLYRLDPDLYSLFRTDEIIEAENEAEKVFGTKRLEHTIMSCKPIYFEFSIVKLA